MDTEEVLKNKGYVSIADAIEEKGAQRARAEFAAEKAKYETEKAKYEARIKELEAALAQK